MEQSVNPLALARLSLPRRRSSDLKPQLLQTAFSFAVAVWGLRRDEQLKCPLPAHTKTITWQLVWHKTVNGSVCSFKFAKLNFCTPNCSCCCSVVLVVTELTDAQHSSISSSHYKAYCVWADGFLPLTYSQCVTVLVTYSEGLHTSSNPPPQSQHG